MPSESSSAASDVNLPPFGSRIIRAMQPSAVRGKTAECVATRLSAVRVAGALLVVDPMAETRSDARGKAITR
jgi:hypothetical protein